MNSFVIKGLTNSLLLFITYLENKLFDVYSLLQVKFFHNSYHSLLNVICIAKFDMFNKIIMYCMLNTFLIWWFKFIFPQLVIMSIFIVICNCQCLGLLWKSIVNVNDSSMLHMYCQAWLLLFSAQIFKFNSQFRNKRRRAYAIIQVHHPPILS